MSERKERMSAGAETMVLDAWLASKTGESRKWAKTQIADGKVDVNGAVCEGGLEGGERERETSLDKAGLPFGSTGGWTMAAHT